MTSPRFVFPKPRLGRLLHAPGGILVVEALAGAEANLAALAPACLEDLRCQILALEAQFLQAASRADAAVTHALYGIAVDAIGFGKIAGVEAIDVALRSLCKLLDHLQSACAWDEAAIAVHVRALTYLAAETAPEPQGVAAMLQGLERVTAKYDAQAPQTAAVVAA